MSSPRLGQRLSLISKSNIKYEGTLSNIDASQNTLTLANVTLFGTENRPSEKGFLPKSESVYEYIVFRGNDIKDLTVYNNPNAFPADPAIVTAGPPKLQHPQDDAMYGNQQLYNQPSYNQQHQPHHQYVGKGYEKERMRPVDDYSQRNSGGGGGYGGRKPYYNNNYNSNNNSNANHNHSGNGGYRRGGGGAGGGKGRRDYASHTGVEFANAKSDTMEMVCENKSPPSFMFAECPAMREGDQDCPSHLLLRWRALRESILLHKQR
ncbi:Protein sum2 [Diplonema papillatum]|nr:Protein sum2 [Diplonema papillatum]